MDIDTRQLNIVVGAANALVFVVPTLVRLVSDTFTRSSRNYSWIPNKRLHLVTACLRLALIAGTLALSLLMPPTASSLWNLSSGALGLLLLFFHFSGETKYRLYLDATTGLITWTRLSRIAPHWRRPVAFIDTASPLRESHVDLFGLTRLVAHWNSSTHGNGGDYSQKELDAICKDVNDYLAAFERHDSNEAHAYRTQFRQKYERKHAAANDRSAMAKADAELRTQEAQATQLAAQKQQEQERLRHIDNKFRK